MSTQLPLPASWAQVESRRDPKERLEALDHDMAAASAKIRQALEELAIGMALPAATWRTL
jgi:hypothetical protein